MEIGQSKLKETQMKQSKEVGKISYGKYGGALALIMNDKVIPNQRVILTCNGDLEMPTVYSKTFTYDEKIDFECPLRGVKVKDPVKDSVVNYSVDGKDMVAKIVGENWGHMKFSLNGIEFGITDLVISSDSDSSEMFIEASKYKESDITPAIAGHSKVVDYDVIKKAKSELI